MTTDISKIMNKKRLSITLLPLVIFICLAILFARGLQLDPHKLPSALIGKPLPVFTLTTLDGKTISEKDLQGKVLLLNVWASWCLTCRVEHAELMNIAASHQILIYGLNYKDQLDAANSWLQAFGNPYVATIYDPKGMFALNLGVYGVPETYLIDKQGIIRYKQVGEITNNNWQSVILPLAKTLEKS